jgi:hypothetical protein
MESGGEAMARLKVGQKITVKKTDEGTRMKDHTLEYRGVSNAYEAVMLSEPDGTEWAFYRSSLKALVAMFKK